MIQTKQHSKFQFLSEIKNPEYVRKRKMTYELLPVQKLTNLKNLKQVCLKKVLQSQIFSENFSKTQGFKFKQEQGTMKQSRLINNLISSSKSVRINIHKPLQNYLEKQIGLSFDKDLSSTFIDCDRKNAHDGVYQQKSILSTKAGSEKSQRQNFQFCDINEDNQIVKIHNKKIQEKKSVITQPKIEDFQLLNFCGEGVFGSVFVARHKQTNYLCAIKKVLKSALTNPQDHQTLIREIKIHSGLSHSNIIKFYGCFSCPFAIYFILQLCQQGNLYQMLQKYGVFNEKDARQIMRQVCAGIDYLHNKDIIHRDIKAENIVVHNKVAKICDFGWASQGEYSRQSLCGTPAYISPEVVQNQQYDKKIDIWSLGVLTYELLVGKIPFDINSPEDFHKVVNQELQFPEQVQISDICKDFILKCLEKNSFKRWDTSRLLAHPFLKRL